MAADTQDNNAQFTPHQMLAKIKQDAVAEGHAIPPQAEAAFTALLGEMLGTKGKAQSAAALSEGIERMKADIAASNAAGKFAAAFGAMVSDKGGLTEQAQRTMSEATRKQLKRLDETRIATPDEDGEVPKGTMSQKQWNQTRNTILENEKATNAAYAKAAQAVSDQMSPALLNNTLMGMLDEAKRMLVPEAPNAGAHGKPMSFTPDQSQEIANARKLLGGSIEVQQGTAPQTSSAMQRPVRGTGR